MPGFCCNNCGAMVRRVSDKPAAQRFRPVLPTDGGSWGLLRSLCVTLQHLSTTYTIPAGVPADHRIKPVSAVGCCGHRFRAQWFYRNRTCPSQLSEAARSVGAQVPCSSSGRRPAVGTQTLDNLRVAAGHGLECRDVQGHLLTEGQQSQRIVSRNHGREAGGDRIEILNRFR